MLIKRRLTSHIVDSTSRGNLFTTGQRIGSSKQAHAQPVDASERHTGSNMKSRNYITWRSPLDVSVRSLNPPISFHTAHVCTRTDQRKRGNSHPVLEKIRFRY